MSDSSNVTKGGGMSKSKRSSLQGGRWDEMYQRLVAYQKVHGNCLVPNRYEEDPQLGAWVSTQRRHYKLVEAGESSPMAEHRIELLEKIGFKWAAKNPRHLQWETRFQALVRFKERYGHTQVPINWEKDVQLANWISTQRQEYQNLLKGRTTRLDERRIRLLNGLGFSWQLQRGGRKRELQEIKRPAEAESVNVQATMESMLKREVASKEGANVDLAAIGNSKTSSLNLSNELVNGQPDASAARPEPVQQATTLANNATTMGSSSLPNLDLHQLFANTAGGQQGLASQLSVVAGTTAQCGIPQNPSTAQALLSTLAQHPTMLGPNNNASLPTGRSSIPSLFPPSNQVATLQLPVQVTQPLLQIPARAASVSSISDTNAILAALGLVLPTNTSQTQQTQPTQLVAGNTTVARTPDPSADSNKRARLSIGNNSVLLDSVERTRHQAQVAQLQALIELQRLSQQAS